MSNAGENQVPMSDLAGAASLLIPFAERASASLTQLWRERRAAMMPYAVDANLIDAALDESLAHLQVVGGIDRAWWQRILDRIGLSPVPPDFLQWPAVQTWLAAREVEADVKALARERLIGSSAHDEVRFGRLVRKYSEATGENAQHAQVPIEVVLAVLTAGYLARIDVPLARVVGIMQASDQETRTAIREVGERVCAIGIQLSQLGPDAHVVDVHSDLALRELSQIRKRRALAPEQVRLELRALIERITSGELCVDGKTRSIVLYWAARLFAHQADQLAIARAYLAELHRIDAHADTRIIQALILEKEGHAEEAIRILRDVEDPDGRSTLFAVLFRTQGKETALGWFDGRADRDDPNCLTGFGWALVLPALAEAGRWDEALRRSASAASQHVEECPNLAFIDAILNTAVLLPYEHRPDALRMNVFHPSIGTVEGGDTGRHRARAYDQFGLAEQLMTRIGEKGHAEAALVFQIWLRVTDPRPEVGDVARRELEDGLRDGARAIALLPLAYAFGIRFNAEPVGRYLAQRAALGGLNERELNAEFLLAKMNMSSRDFATYLERDELRLRQALPSATLAGMRIEALVADGQTSRARQVLEERRPDFEGYDYERLGALIMRHEGGDPRATLERVYGQTNSLLDLRNLAEHLYEVQDWRGLRPLLEELFRRQPTSEDARHLISCMARDSSAGQPAIASFFDTHEEVGTWGHPLASAKAWAFFYMGRLREARDTNNTLLAARSDSSDLHLDINLALQSGDWERFPAIVEREWDRRDAHPPEVLLRLAMLAAEADRHSTRAYELASLAAEKGADDPRVLINAYMLAVQLGREGEREAGWIIRGAELSTENGPVWRLDLRAIAQSLPARRERILRILDALRQGELPLHLAAEAMSVPLARFMIDVPRWNHQHLDGRGLTIVPIVSGARPPVALDAAWAIGLDVTSVMTLRHLDLLEVVCTVFRRIVLAPAIMTVLLDERRRARFHQPQRAREAEELRGFMNDGRLAVSSSFPVPPPWLVEEVGRDLAELLAKAHAENAVVIHPRPIHRLGAFLEAQAELREYDPFVVSTTALTRLLYDRGYLNRDGCERALRYLCSHDHGDERGDAAILARPMLLDSLAVTFLQHAGVLALAVGSNLALHVHPSLASELDAIAAANREGERLAQALDSIRIALRDALVQGRVTFLPRSIGGGEELGTGAILTHFVQDVGVCDAVCIDDRYANAYARLTDSSGRTIPLACVLDVLSFLTATRAIDDSRLRNALHWLRQSGFGLLPLQRGELHGAICSAQCDANGEVIENAELRVLRERLMRIRAIGMVVLPREESFLLSYHRECMSEILRLWQDEALPSERAGALSDWIWRNLMPSPLDWVKATDQTQREHQAEAFARQVSTLVWLVGGVPERRRDAFRAWVEQSVLEPLLPASPELVDLVSTIIADDISRLVERFRNGAITFVS